MVPALSYTRTGMLVFDSQSQSQGLVSGHYLEFSNHRKNSLTATHIHTNRS